MVPVAFKTRQNDATVSEACTADEAVKACGEYAEPVFGECSVECGSDGERTATRCFIYNADNGGDEVCVDSVEECADLGPCFGECKCDSTDALNLAAKKCQTDNENVCEPCDTSVCGEFGEAVPGECSTTCGPGVREVKSCFEWENDAIPPNVRLAQQCRTANEACNEGPENACPTFDNCACTSEDKDNLSAEEEDQFGNTRPCDTAVCGAYTNWSDFGECSATCGGGVQSRTRCFEFANNVVADQCEEEEQPCNRNECPKWAAWKAWSACDGTCTDRTTNIAPKRTRYRCWDKKDGSPETCENDSSCPADGCYQEQEEECNTELCELECIWTEWGPWGVCTPNCATGLQIRRRTSNEDQGAACTGNGADSRVCEDSDVECPVCADKYEKCSKISKVFCTDIRYKAQLERLCNKWCGYCESTDRRKRRAINKYARDFNIGNIETLEFLASITN